MPSPTAPAGLVVRSQSAAAPPVASSVARAEIAPPSVVTPTQREAVDQSPSACSPSTDRDPRMVEHAFGERVRDLASGRRAAGVHDAGARVSAFEPEAGVELDSEIGEVGDARGGFVGEDGDGARAAEPAARRDRVLCVQSWIVVRPDRGGDATLREVARSRLDRALRQHDHVGLVGGAESGVEASDAAADDEEIALRSCARRVTFRICLC